MSSKGRSHFDKYVFVAYVSTGQEVRLKKDTLQFKQESAHPEITPDLIKEGIERPHRIGFDADHDNRSNYYRLMTSPIENVGYMQVLKVVTEKNDKGHHEVVTSYLLSNLRGEHHPRGLYYDSAKQED